MTSKVVPLSKRHHYIPEFFIKGFVGQDGKVAVYNKEKNKLEPSRKSPKQVFYEWNRNTFNIDGEDTDFVEDLYKFHENQFAPVYKKIIEQNGPLHIDATDLFHLIHFLGVLYWRIPLRDNEMLDFMQNASSKDLLLRVRDKETGLDAPQEIFEGMKKEPSFIQGSKIMMAVIDFMKTDFVSDLDNWRTGYSGSNVQLHLLSDNPVIIRNQNDSRLFPSELIFPISKGKTLYHIYGKAFKMLPPEHRASVDLLAFLQTDRIICGPNGDYLADIAQIASRFSNENEVKDLKEEVFNFFN